MLKTVCICAFLFMNVVGFLLMGIDKRRARKEKWRIKEKTLFLVALLGGGVGSTIGMYTFRHKTKHWYFVVGMPLLGVVNLVAMGYLLHFLGTL